MKIWFGIVLIFFACDAISQNLYYTPQQVINANTALACNNLSSEAKNLVFYINLLRTNPKLFSKTIAKHYLDSAKFSKSNYIKTLEVFLNEAEPMPLLFIEKDLTDEAQKHASDMGVNGLLGHETSNGNTFEQRFETLANNYSIVQENCQYGYANALDVLMDLLIDEGIEDYGHRYTLMNSRLRFIGVSFQPHTKYKVNCVLDFGGKKIN